MSSESAARPLHAGRLFLVTAPSGAGKSSLVNALLKLEPTLKLSISHTTRQPRPGEVNGREYHFVSEHEFLAMRDRSEFLESALVHGNYYGTVGIFILPPSIEALEWRLHHRGTDSEQTITRRLLGAGAEMSHAPEFEYVIINEDFETALSQMQAVVVASRLAFGQQAVRHREQFASLGIPL